MMKKRWILAVLVLCIVLSLAACRDKSSPMPLGNRTISGVVSGLTVTGMVLQSNGADDLLITSGSTTFTFATKIADLSTYNVTVLSQPTTSVDYEACVVANSSGTVSGADITNVLVTCTTSTWETLAANPESGNTVAFSDFTPAGKQALYSLQSGTLQVFSFPTTSDPQGVFTALTGTTSSDGYIGLAWVGNRLFTVDGNSVYVYDINGDSWTTAMTGTLTYSHGHAQTTADDSGFIYSVASTTALLKFNTANSTFEYITTPADVTHSEPRTVWDSKTKRVYIADYNSQTGFYAFNPADGTFTALASLPDAAGMRDAFCTDRRGHIYTADTNVTMWMYTAATDTWENIPELPFVLGDSPSCTVSADGWLFFGSDSGDFARIKIF
ncbi:MAG: hypothetical protein AABZ15_14950 [Nitrospirota bacterium]